MTEQGFLENEIKNFKSGAEYKALADMVDSLQKENAKLKELEKENKISEEIIIGEQQEINELKKEKEWLEKTDNEQTDLILKLYEQIEKMKCCGNCDNNAYCDKEHYGNDKGCNEWGLAE